MRMKSRVPRLKASSRSALVLEMVTTLAPSAAAMEMA